jgi:hypothetical protein
MLTKKAQTSNKRLKPKVKTKKLKYRFTVNSDGFLVARAYYVIPLRKV